MSFFKNAMANVLGVGGAKVDTIPSSSNVHPGDTVTGIIKIYGGKIEQTINAVNLSVKTNYEKESDNKKIMVNITIQKVPISIGRSLLPDENLEIPFSFILSENCPISTYRFPVKLSTNLDIASAIDSSDGDILNVTPSYRMQNILDAMSELGFRAREIENIPSLRRTNNMPFIQEFEFTAQSSPFYGRLDEVEIIFAVNMYGIDLHLQIDRKANSIAGLFAEALNLDESFIRLDLVHEELEQTHLIKENLFSVINNHC